MKIKRIPLYCVGMLVSLSACIGNQGISGRFAQHSATTTPYASPTGGILGANVSANCTIAVPVTPLQRLTSQQYLNSVTALLHLTPGAALATLPQDEVVGPFAANTQAAVGDLSADQYQTAATAYAAQAMGNLNALLPCAPKALNAACAQQFVTTFGQRAFRRPLTTDEVTRYMTLASTRAANDPNGIRLIVQAFLQSPYFIYRPEFGDSTTASQGTVALTPFEQASRLAFFLWNSTPDDTLLQAAANGAMNDANGVGVQIDRMQTDARYGASVGSYVTNLLSITSFSGVQKDPNIYPSYTPALQSALLQETQDFVSYVMSQDGTFKSLLTSDETVPSAALLNYYGVTAPPGGATTVALDSVQRGGILTRGAFLAIHGHSNASAPVPRGRIVRENLLCQLMPAPPPGVSTVPPIPKAGSTTRQLLLGHESNASCAQCHVLMDHIGFGFEHFDGVGAWRDTDSGQPVDASGNISGTTASNVAFNGANDLSAQLAASKDVDNCVVLQMYRYGLERSEVAADACTLGHLKQSFVASGGDLRALMKAVAQSQAFGRLSVAP